MIRMFPEVHMVGVRHGAHGRARAAANHGGKSTGKRGGGKSRNAMAAEVESD